MLTARLFGEPEFLLHGHPLPIKGKPAALLALLCFGALSRSEAKRLLWGRDAAHNLRQAIYSLKKLPHSELWFFPADPLELQVQTNLEADWQSDLPLLQGFEHSLSDEGLEWLALEREKLRLQRVGKLFTAAREQQDKHLLERVLQLDPLHESAAQLLMRLHLESNARDLALEVYGRLRAALLRELGTKPLPETAAILDNSLIFGSPEHLRLERAYAVVGKLEPHLIAAIVEREALEVAEVLAGVKLDSAAIRAATPPRVWQLLNRRAAEATHDLQQAAHFWLEAGEPEAAAQAHLELAKQRLATDLEFAKTHCLEALISQNPDIQLEALVLLRQICEQKNDLELLATVHQHLQKLALATQRDDVEFYAHIAMASLLIRTGRTQETLEPLLDAERAAKRLGQQVLLEQVQLLRATASLLQGDLVAAQTLLLPLREAHNINSRISVHSNLGAIAGMQQDPNTALGYFETALQLARQAGNLVLSARIVFNIATTAEKLERFERATKGWRETKELSERLGDVVLLATAYGNLAATFVKLGQLGIAWNTACELLELEVTTGRFMALSALANVAWQLSELELAGELWQKALEFAQKQQNQRWVNDVHFALTLLHGNEEDAFALLQNPAGLSDFQENCFMFALHSQRPALIHRILPPEPDTPRSKLLYHIALVRLELLESRTPQTNGLQTALSTPFLETPLGWQVLARAQGVLGQDPNAALLQCEQAKTLQRQGLPRDLRRSLLGLTLD